MNDTEDGPDLAEGVSGQTAEERCAEPLGVRRSMSRGGINGTGTELGRALPPQSERLLEQMRKCVMVHHQLSCLLIHSAAVKAGLYNADGAATPALCDADSCDPERACALEQSIQNLGGSTTRLFSVTLRDEHDCESMEETLQRRVDEMIDVMRKEYEGQLAGAADSRVDLAQARTMGAAGERERALSPASMARGAELTRELFQVQAELACAGREFSAADVQEASRSASAERAEAEALSEECERLADQLSARRADAAELRRELEEVWRESEGFHRAHTISRFAEVERAAHRNSELEAAIQELPTAPASGPWGGTGPGRPADTRGGQARHGVQAFPVSAPESAQRLPGPLRPGRTREVPDGRKAHYWVDPRLAPGEQPRLREVDVRAKHDADAAPPPAMGSVESLAQLDLALRLSQAEFWGT